MVRTTDSIALLLVELLVVTLVTFAICETFDRFFAFLRFWQYFESALYLVRMGFSSRFLGNVLVFFPGVLVLFPLGNVLVPFPRVLVFFPCVLFLTMAPCLDFRDALSAFVMIGTVVVVVIDPSAFNTVDVFFVVTFLKMFGGSVDEFDSGRLENWEFSSLSTVASNFHAVKAKRRSDV